MHPSVVTLDPHRARAAAAQVKGLLERLAHALVLGDAVHRDAIDHDHHRAGQRRRSIAEARGELQSFSHGVIGEQAMVPVLDQERRGVRERARSGLERREEQVRARRREHARACIVDAVAADLVVASRTHRPSHGREEQPHVTT